jgi:hypothetical protein
MANNEAMSESGPCEAVEQAIRAFPAPFRWAMARIGAATSTTSGATSTR